MKAGIAIALAAAAVAVAEAGRPLKYMMRDRWFERRGQKLSGAVALPPDQWFTQTLDHFDVTSDTTWQQRYWVNATFFKPGTGAVFVYVEGEGAGSPYDVLEGEHMELAQQYGALVVALEHRYYGASIPTPDLSTANLAFLSSHQAVGDVATFLTDYVFPTYNINTGAQKVVTFGGSYPGALSAWLRLRLPHLISVAVSTSSPIQAQLDFTGYNTVVGQSLGKASIGGSAACVQATTAAFTAMDAAFQAGGATRSAMATKLNSCQDLSAVNDTMWAASNYGGAVQGMVQYNDEEGGYDVRAFCAQMTAPGAAPIDNLAKAMLSLNGPSCVDNSYADFVAQFSNVTANPGAGGVGIRQWTYQTCTQFGYYQTCEDRTVCPLSLYMTLDSNTQQCADLFGPGFNGARAQTRINFTNSALGGQGIKGSRIIFVNGNVDPWHALSLWNTTDASAMPSVFIDGTAHCRNMMPSSPSDPPALVAARQQINAYLAAFMAQ